MILLLGFNGVLYIYIFKIHNDRFMIISKLQAISYIYILLLVKRNGWGISLVKVMVNIGSIFTIYKHFKSTCDKIILDSSMDP